RDVTRAVWPGRPAASVEPPPRVALLRVGAGGVGGADGGTTGRPGSRVLGSRGGMARADRGIARPRGAEVPLAGGPVRRAAAGIEPGAPAADALASGPPVGRALCRRRFRTPARIDSDGTCANGGDNAGIRGQSAGTPAGAGGRGAAEHRRLVALPAQSGREVPRTVVDPRRPASDRSVRDERLRRPDFGITLRLAGLLSKPGIL